MTNPWALCQHILSCQEPFCRDWGNLKRACSVLWAYLKPHKNLLKILLVCRDSWSKINLLYIFDKRGRTLAGILEVLSREAWRRLEKYLQVSTSLETIDWLIQFVKACKHKSHCFRISARMSPLEDLSNLTSIMTFLTSTNVTCWKEI